MAGKEQPDIACLQELKAADEDFPDRPSSRGRLRRALARPALLERRGHPRARQRCRRDAAAACPAIPTTLRAAISKPRRTAIIVGCLYLPNGNPQPGPKFDYKLAWFERLIAHAADAVRDSGHPVVLAGDYNVVPTDFDIYNPRSWRKDALLQPESRAPATQRLLAQGWTDALRTLHPDERSTRSGITSRTLGAQRGAAHRPPAAEPAAGPAARGAGVDRWVRALPEPATTRRPGSR